VADMGFSVHRGRTLDISNYITASIDLIFHERAQIQSVQAIPHFVFNFLGNELAAQFHLLEWQPHTIV
jgi:hypothetical protein